jgi:hypothetical protein
MRGARSHAGQRSRDEPSVAADRRVAGGVDRVAGFARSGALAGAASALGFAVIHHVLISDIWFSAVAMVAAGAVCGLCVAWTYGIVAGTPSVSGWLRYNATHVGLFGLLGAVSVAVFEPVTTVAALVAADGPPGDLIGTAMPMTLAFVVAASVVVGALHARRWSDLGPITVTMAVLVLVLGLNVSVIGLVEIPAGSAFLVVELFGLIVAIDVMFVAVFAALERSSLRRRPSGR